jgi:hypothetical protein
MRPTDQPHRRSLAIASAHAEPAHIHQSARIAGERQITHIRKVVRQRRETLAEYSLDGTVDLNYPYFWPALAFDLPRGERAGALGTARRDLSLIHSCGT